MKCCLLSTWNLPTNMFELVKEHQVISWEHDNYEFASDYQKHARMID